jgi:hypothetical protein
MIDYKISFGKPEREREVESLRHGWGTTGSIKMDLKEIMCESVGIYLAWDTVQLWALVNAVMNIREP